MTVVDAVTESVPLPARVDVLPHAVAAGEVLVHLGSDTDRGLTEAEADGRRVKYGANELAETPPPPLWRKIFAQVGEPVVLILLAVAALSAGIGQWTDALAILAIVVLNTILGVYQEQRAEHALAALRKLSAPLARVVRDGLPRTVPARELVPGDRVELEAGDYVPADVRLIAATGLRVQEAALTGESEPSDKEPDAVLATAIPLADRRNMAYLGTVVAAGKASAVVTATGMRTELGRIAGMLQTNSPEPTPLQRRLGELGRVISVGCLVLAAAVERHIRADGDHETAVPGLWLYRSSTPSEEHPVVYVPSLCVVVQGAKEVVVGGEVYRYDPAQSLLVSVDMPAFTRVADATADRPCLAVRIPIDSAVVGELLADGSATPPPGPPARGLGVINLEPPLLDAVCRLLGLLDAPHEIAALGPLVLREITFRLLTGPEGARLRQIAAAGGPAQRVARALRWLRDHFAEPLRIETLAKHVGMSPSALHLHFKNVTALGRMDTK